MHQRHAPHSEPDLRQRALSALERANELSDAEDHTQAIAYYEEALSAFAHLDAERWNLLVCVFNLGLCLRQADRLDAAIGAFARALALAEDQRTPFDTERERKTVQCKTHDELGKVLADKQSFTESLHHFTTALDIAKTMRDSLELQGIIRRHMANVLEDKGDTDQALAVCGQALEDLQTAGSEPYEIHQTTVDLATVHIVRDEHATAVDLLHEAIKGFESLPGTESAIAHARASLANALRFLGRFAEAERQYALADTVFRRSGRQSSIAYNLQNSALNYAEQGKWEAANRTYSEALSKFEELGVSDYETGRTLMNHSETIRLTGNPERAEAVCRRAIAVLDRAEEAGGLVGMAYTVLGCCLKDQQRLPEAEAALMESVRLIEQNEGSAYSLAYAEMDLGVVIADQCRFDEAAPHFERAREDFLRCGMHYEANLVNREEADALQRESERADDAEKKDALLVEALSLAVRAAVDADERRFQFPASDARMRWIQRVAEPSRELALSLAADAQDAGLVSELVASWRTSGVVSPSSGLERARGEDPGRPPHHPAQATVPITGVMATDAENGVGGVGSVEGLGDPSGGVRGSANAAGRSIGPNLVMLHGSRSTLSAYAPDLALRRKVRYR